jgi:Icc-related predicted phosphoesterase
MKIVAFSDTHGLLFKDVPKCDVVIIAGDITPLNIQNDVDKCIAWFCMEFVPWAEALPCKKVLFVAGNHDRWLEAIGPKAYRKAKEVMNMLFCSKRGNTKIEYLQDNYVEIEGKKFYGFPWCPHLSNWAFYKTDEELETQVEHIPHCDVLITHCPPKNTLQSTVLQPGWNHMADFGCLQLTELIGRRVINWCICGHIHSGKHTPDQLVGTNVVNVSIKDEDYKPSYDVFVFEI